MFRLILGSSFEGESGDFQPFMIIFAVKIYTHLESHVIYM